MDENKVKVLEEIGYKINSCCVNCVHGEFYTLGFGSCHKNTYVHLKHQNPEGGRPLSVHATGWCPQFEPRNELHDAWLRFAEWE